MKTQLMIERTDKMYNETHNNHKKGRVIPMSTHKGYKTSNDIEIPRFFVEHMRNEKERKRREELRLIRQKERKVRNLINCIKFTAGMILGVLSMWLLVSMSIILFG